MNLCWTFNMNMNAIPVITSVMADLSRYTDKNYPIAGVIGLGPQMAWICISTLPELE